MAEIVKILQLITDNDKITDFIVKNCSNNGL